HHHAGAGARQKPAPARHPVAAAPLLAADRRRHPQRPARTAAAAVPLVQIPPCPGGGGGAAGSTYWGNENRKSRRFVTYAGLVERPVAIGIDDKEANVRNKLSRGKITAAFLLQCLSAIDVDSVRL